MDKEKALDRLERNWSREDFRDANNGLKHFVATKEGRRAFWWLLGECGTFSTPDNERETGMQSVGHLLLSRISECDDEAFIKTLTENRNHERDRDRKRNNIRDNPDTGGYEPGIDPNYDPG